jgi:hypothetical protein
MKKLLIVGMLMVGFVGQVQAMLVVKKLVALHKSRKEAQKQQKEQKEWIVDNYSEKQLLKYSYFKNVNNISDWMSAWGPLYTKEVYEVLLNDACFNENPAYMVRNGLMGHRSDRMMSTDYLDQEINSLD